MDISDMSEQEFMEALVTRPEETVLQASALLAGLTNEITRVGMALIHGKIQPDILTSYRELVDELVKDDRPEDIAPQIRLARACCRGLDAFFREMTQFNEALTQERERKEREK